ncbi:hypothetical protein TEA_013793 [Camellia sinensis var. sinensis]|uniref:Uncharacterized protein n=1 Tax=Camellia sinensis var. sinensis TaxID=542762 RepID=A0A4V3WMP3_CAMSN|nr:hypothetical protein TEA_013793 [Camellia sinensis var. sinensis]
MLNQNQNMETVGLKVKNQMLKQSNAFMKQHVMGLLTISLYPMNIDISDVRYPDVAKFRHMPLQFTKDLDILFSHAAATREWAYTPSLRVMPHTDETLEEFHTPHDAEFHDDADLEVVHPSDLNEKCPSNTDGSSNKSNAKKKFSGASLLNKTLNCIVNVVESSLTTSTQTSSTYPSIAECLAKLESIPGVSPDNELYVWAARLFLRDKRRECFMTLPTDKVRLRFLKLAIELEKTTIGYDS